MSTITHQGIFNFFILFIKLKTIIQKRYTKSIARIIAIN